MAGVKGKSGTKVDKIWRDAVMRAVHRLEEGDGKKTKRLEMLADQLVMKALDGDTAALKEIGDRLDGKPSQQVQLTGEDGGAIKIERIERVVIDPINPNA